MKKRDAKIKALQFSISILDKELTQGMPKDFDRKVWQEMVIVRNEMQRRVNCLLNTIVKG